MCVHIYIYPLFEQYICYIVTTQNIVLLLQYMKDNVLTRLNFKVFLYSIFFFINFIIKFPIVKVLLCLRCCWFEIARSHAKRYSEISHHFIDTSVKTKHRVWQLLPLVRTVFRNLSNGRMRKARSLLYSCIQPLWGKTP